jgi:hypothetical protein
VPALVRGLGDDPLRPGRQVEVVAPRELRSADQPMAMLPAPLGIEKVVGKRICVSVGEAEAAQVRPDLVLSQGGVTRGPAAA